VVDAMPRRLGGRYEVGKLIGRGGMAEVHVGQDTRLGRRVAIKLLRSDLALDPTFQARFRREAQSAAALNHPAIVAVYDSGEDVLTSESGAVTHLAYIVMEYVEGHTVRELLKDGQAVPIEEAVEIVSGVLGALEYSHHAGIVHRDIKPGNVMLTTTGAVKVMDFGIARAMSDPGATMTATHAVVGTAQYLSPEQARGEPVDARSDLYSTGCLLYELLTGRPPFLADSPVAVAYKHVSEDPVPPSKVAADVPESLEDRNQRYQTAAEFRADLDEAVAGGDVGAPPVGALAAAGAVGTATAATAVLGAPAGATQVYPPTDPGLPAQESTPEEQPERSRRGLVWFLVVLGVAAVAGIVWLAMRGGDGTPETVSVPDLAALTEVDLDMSSQQEASEDVEEGLAIRWEPTDEAEPGSVVEVWFSSGPDAIEIPDISGLSQARAREELSRAGFTGIVSTRTENAPGVAQDVAVGTEPAAGESASADAAITLILGTGLVEVPDLTGQTEADALATLDGLELSSRITYEPAAGDSGRVISQDRTGAVAVDATVTLTVSEAEASPTPEPTPTDSATPAPTEVASP
jgi:beta-lactam-binding protein with PASTA domain